jgi:hypothetical protein
LDEYADGNGKRQKPKAILVEIEEVTDLDGDGAIGVEDVKLLLELSDVSAYGTDLSLG